MAAVSALLAVDGLTKRFGGVQRSTTARFAVEEGTITALIGPNGSGKTTVFNLITGYLPADAGDGDLRGRRVRRPDPTRLARAGLARTFQQARVFPELTRRREPRGRRCSCPGGRCCARRSDEPSASAPTNCSTSSG